MFVSTTYWTRNQWLLRIERNLDYSDRRIAVWRSGFATDFHDRSRFLTLPDDVRLSIAVCDDISDVSIVRQIIEGLKAQCHLLNPAVIVVGRNSLAGGHTAERYRRYVGEDAHRQTCEVFVHYLSLQVLGRDIPDELDARQWLSLFHRLKMRKVWNFLESVEYFGKCGKLCWFWGTLSRGYNFN